MMRAGRIFSASGFAFVWAFLALVLFNVPAARAVEVERVVSPGGIEAWLVEDHSNPIISMEFAFKGGSSVDPDGKEGLANFVASTIDEGAGALDSQAFQGKLEDLNITLRYDAGRETLGGTFVTLVKHLDEATELLRLSLSEPRFDEEPVERIRSQISLVLERRAEDPGYRAQARLRELFFAGHPYGRPSDGSQESLARITAKDLRGYVADYFARDNLVVGVVGDITPDALGKLLDKAFLALPAHAKGVEIADTRPRVEGGVVVLDQDVPQSQVVMAQPGISRDDPNYYTAYLVNHILGGGSFSSRLYQEVREKRGLTYSVGSYLYTLDHAPLLMASVATQNGRVAESVDLIKQEWRRMAEAGPSAEELEAAKTYLTGSFPLRFTSTGRVAGILLAMQLDDLGLDYLDRRNSLIEGVTLEDAKRVAKRLYDPQALTVVVVGRPDGLEPEEPRAVTKP